MRWEDDIREGAKRDNQVRGNSGRSITEVGYPESDGRGEITSESSVLNEKCTSLLDGLLKMEMPSRGSSK